MPIINITWIILAVSFLLLWPSPGLGDPEWSWIVEKLTGFAQRKRLAILALGALSILARQALLHWFPVPQPKVHDEFSYLLAADTFAHGRLANPSHPLWVFFDTFHVIQRPTYASMYPPAQGVVMALGRIFFGHPWAGVVLSVAAMCMAFTWMLQGWMPAEWALLGGLIVWARFGVFSYWMNSYWGGAVAATGAALALGALARIWDHARFRDALIFGLGMGIVAISRPVEGAIYFLPLAAALLWWALRRNASERATAVRRVILPVAALFLCTAAFIGFYNWRVTGNPLVFPHFIEQKEITTAIFLWQHDKPPIHYDNPQFEDFYHNFLPGLYQASWPAAEGQWWYKSSDFWEFFLGPALSIPFLALPWILWKQPRTRLLLLQVALSGFGLWIIVYYHAHYAAPLMATVFLLLMLCLRELWRLRLFGIAVGEALVRLVVMFSLLIGPVYFAQATVPQLGGLEEWLHGHLVLPFVIALAALGLLRAGRWILRNRSGSTLIAACEFLLLLCIVLHTCEIQRNLYSDAFPYVDDIAEPFRQPVEKQLAALPGEHLVLVRYSKDHNSGEEYVYNDADIDHAKTVWAREIPGKDLRPLLQYFRNRDVWLYQPDEDDGTVTPYDVTLK